MAAFERIGRGDRHCFLPYQTATHFSQRNHAQPKAVLLGNAQELEGAPLQDYKAWVAQPGGSEQQQPPPATGRKFTVGFWEPLEPVVKSARRVFVSADGVLNQVALGVAPRSDGSLVMDAYEVRMVSSTKDLLRQPVPVASKTALLVGNPALDLSEAKERAALVKLAKPEKPEPDRTCMASSGATTLRGEQGGDALPPLKEAQIEVCAIAKFLRQQGWEVSEHTGQEALLEWVKRANGPRVLQLATHGFFLPDQPLHRKRTVGLHSDEEARGLEDPMLRSGLYFAGANRTPAHQPMPDGLNNGVLTAYEASTLKLQGTELVVLSACYTGLGETLNGEGVFGLQRGLQEAGAQAVLMSKWGVPDKETQELMNRFYQKWLGGKSKHEALTDAQQEIRAEVRKKHRGDFPWHWGAFVLVGP